MLNNEFAGKLITFCGLDGCGKTTQIKRLAKWLEENGHKVYLTKQPTDFVRESDIFRTYMDSPEHDDYYTVAEPFSDEQREALGMTEITNDYYLENLQSFERENSNKVIYMHSAPIEQTGNEIQENETTYLAEGTYFRKSFPKTLSSNNPIEIGNTDNYANCFLNKNSVVGKLSES